MVSAHEEWQHLFHADCLESFYSTCQAQSTFPCPFCRRPVEIESIRGSIVEEALEAVRMGDLERLWGLFGGVDWGRRFDVVLLEAVKVGNVGIVDFLIGIGACIESSKTRIAAELAIEWRKLDIVELLICKGGLSEFDERILFFYAIRKGNVAIINLFVKRKTPIYEYPVESLFGMESSSFTDGFKEAATTGNLTVFKLLLSHYRINEASKQRAAVAAATFGHLPIIQHLHRAYRLKLHSHYGQILEAAVHSRQMPVIRYLMDNWDDRREEAPLVPWIGSLENIRREVVDVYQCRHWQDQLRDKRRQT